jgi:hypothetical protein
MAMSGTGTGKAGAASGRGVRRGVARGVRGIGDEA